MERPHVALDKALAFEAHVVEVAEEHPQEQVVTAQHFIWWILTDSPLNNVPKTVFGCVRNYDIDCLYRWLVWTFHKFRRTKWWLVSGLGGAVTRSVICAIPMAFLPMLGTPSVVNVDTEVMIGGCCGQNTCVWGQDGWSGWRTSTQASGVSAALNIYWSLNPPEDALNILEHFYMPGQHANTTCCFF